MKNLKRSETLRIVFISLALFILFSIAATFIFYTVTVADISDTKDELKSTETILNQSERSVISNRIDRLASDLIYIKKTVDMTNTDKAGIESLKKLWIAFSDSTKLFDQIRFIDSKGNELIRVNYADNGSYVVADDKLQNKADRYYFADSIKLKSGQIYISKLDLNIEHDSVEKPDKPMIRLAIPYFDDNGTVRGEIVMNYLAKDLIDSLQGVSSSSRGVTYLLNSEGYWLFNSDDRSTEWTFMYDNRKDQSFSRKYSSEWKTISTGSSGSLITDNGFFTYTSILTSNGYAPSSSGYTLVLGEGDWRVVSHIKPDSSYGKLLLMNNWEILRSSLIKTLPTFLWILLFAVLLTVIVEKGRSKRARMRYLAEYDGLTNILNRRTGLEKLRELCQSSRRSGRPFAVCFVDANGLKDVNDTYGHEAGDALIVRLVNAMQAAVRESDILCRFGGDEFVIVCKNTGGSGAEAIWQRVRRYIEEMNAGSTEPWKLSASHGIASYEPGDDENSITQRADEAMYAEKREMKKAKSD